MTMDYKDKLLHKRMAQAITALRKLAEAMSEYRPEWKFHEADVLIAALGIKILENQLEKEGLK